MPTDDPRDGNIYWRTTKTLSPDAPEAQVDEYIARVNKEIEEEQAKELAKEAEED